MELYLTYGHKDQLEDIYMDYRKEVRSTFINEFIANSFTKDLQNIIRVFSKYYTIPKMFEFLLRINTSTLSSKGVRANSRLYLSRFEK